MELPFQQVFIPADIALIGLLVILEGVLSIDNALVLGLLAKRLPKDQQGRALTYGLVGAFLFRFVAIASAQYLLQWTIVKLIGGGYLLFVAGKYFLFEAWEEKDDEIKIGPDGHPILPDDANDVNPAEKIAKKFAGFWPTVMVIELTDIAFAIDSILAAIALVGAPPAGHVGFHPKLWVVVTGGMLGVILMRVAAVLFIKLLEKFPRFEISAYLLVAVIGFKLVADWWFNTPTHPHTIDFHSPSQPAFWIFWLSMVGSLAIGFLPPKKGNPSGPVPMGTRIIKLLVVGMFVLSLMVGIFLGFVAMQPNEFRISRSTTIAAPPAAVFEQVNDLHQFQEWSPWAKIDPACKVTYDGPPSGKDAAFSWNGNDQAGEGTMTILNSKPSERIEIKLDFRRPFVDTNAVEFSFKPERDETVTTWTITGTHGYVQKVICRLIRMDELVGADFEKGLKQLKERVEAEAKK